MDHAPRIEFTKTQEKKVKKEERKTASTTIPIKNNNFSRTETLNTQNGSNVNFNVNTNSYTNTNGQSNGKSRSTNNTKYIYFLLI